MSDLKEEEIRRYGRQLILKEIGENGQKRLRDARALVVGLGGLGSPASYYLAAAGVGTLGIVDSDVVEISNLQRQLLHRTHDIGRPKTESATEKLRALNPGVTIEKHHVRLSTDNVVQLIRDYDVILDGVDNFAARYLLNDACFFGGKPLVEAGVLQFLGQIMTIVPGKGPCYRCVFPEPPPPGSIPGCREAGILGVVPGVAGVLQATEAIKLIIGIGKSLVGRIIIYEALTGSFREVSLRRNPKCPLCGENPSITGLIEYPPDGETC